MINKFDPTVPNTESRILSEPVRSNFNVLNDRTNQLTPSATTPVSTSVRISAADKMYFADNVYMPFTGGLLDLGSQESGVTAFITPGYFKEIIVYYYNNNGSGALGFVESIPKVNKVRDTKTLINSRLDQRDPTTGSIPTQNLLKGRIPLCSILVTNNGTVGQRGQIVQIGDPDIVDLRPFMQLGGGVEDLATHVNAPTLSAAHPSALIDNNSLIVTGRTSSVPLVASPVAEGSNQIFVSAGGISLFLGREGEPIRIPTAAIGISEITGQTEFITAKIVTVNTSSSYLIVDRALPAIPANRLIINGQITLDKMGFDVATALAEVTNDKFLRIETVGLTESVYKLGLNLVVDENVASTAAIAGTKIVPNFGSQDVTTSGVASLTNTTQSISSSTGALIISGGVGLAKSLYVGQSANIGQTLSVTGHTNLSSLQTSSYISSSGYISTTSYISSGSYITSTSTENATSLTTGALRITAGGASIKSDLRLGGVIFAGSAPTQVTDSTGKVLSNALNTVAILNGGTGSTNKTAAFDALAPTTSPGDLIYRDGSANVRLGVGAANQTLLSSGSAPIWGFISDSNIGVAAAISRSKIASGSGNHVVINDSSGGLSSEAQLSVTRGGTGSSTFTSGYLLVGNNTNPVTTLQHTASNIASTVVSRDATGSFNAGTITATTFSGNVTGNVSGTASNVTGTVAILNGGTGATTKAAAFDALAPSTVAGDLIYRGASNNVSLPISGTANRILASNGSAPSWSFLVDANIASNAGIAFSKLASLSSANILVGSATSVPTAVTVSGAITISNTGVTTLSSGVVTDSNISSGAAISRSKIAIGTVGHVLINDPATGAFTSEAQLRVSRGGTGASTFPAGTLITGNGSSTFTTTQHTSNNTPATVVSRDTDGNFSASTITANLTGTASNATNANNITVVNTTTNNTFYPVFALNTTGSQVPNVASTKLRFNPSTGNMTATSFTGNLIGTADNATNAANIGVTNDNATNSVFYPTFVSSTTGNLPSKVASSKLLFNPSTGNLTATSFTGNLNGGYINGTMQTASTTSATINNSTAIFIYLGAAAPTITLPSDPEDGRIVMIKNTDNSLGIIQRSGTQNIADSTGNTNTTTEITAFGSAVLCYRLADTTWYRIV
jgi:hypothetical protein